MKWFKRSLQFLLMLAVLLAENIAAQQTLTANNSGGYSDVCGVITEETENWVLSVFGQYEDLEQLLWAVDRFAMDNFTYTTDSLNASQLVLQHFDMQQFIERNFRGICFDFSCFCKNVVLIWCEATGEQVQCFVDEVRIDISSGHSYNYFIDDQGTIWYLDATSDNTAYKNGDYQDIWGPVALDGQTIEEFDHFLYADGYWFSLLR